MEQISEKEVLIMAVQLMSSILANPAMSEIRFKSCDSYPGQELLRQCIMIVRNEAMNIGFVGENSLTTPQGG
jgi:hypothetical protein